MYRGLQADTLSLCFHLVSLGPYCSSHHSCDHVLDALAPQDVIPVVPISHFLLFLLPRCHPLPLRLLQCSLHLPDV